MSNRAADDAVVEKLTPELIGKYDIRASYFTAYPPTGVWDETFTSEQTRDVLSSLAEVKEQGYPMSLYVHFPYCHFQCYYCQCYAVVSRDSDKKKAVLRSLHDEIDLVAETFQRNRVNVSFKEVHLGGGSPSVIERQDLVELIGHLRKIVQVEELDEFAIEIDPRTVDEDMMRFYHEVGINRISFGVQDFDPVVQKAVNRVQPFELVERLSHPDIRKLFKGLNFDLIYGLPKQTRESFLHTLELTRQISPDRLAVCNMGYRPDVFPHNRLIHQDDLPNPYDRTMMWYDACRFLTSNGWTRIGLDHYAKDTDDLAIAARARKLHRNTMGYTPGVSHDTLGIGPSALSRINRYYSQNCYDLQEYAGSLRAGRFPTIRGFELSEDNLLRRDVMFSILSYYSLEYAYFERKHGIRFREYFHRELQSEALAELVDDGIVTVCDDRIEATELGKFFLRNICYVFDNLELGYKHNVEYVQEHRTQGKKDGGPVRQGLPAAKGV